MMTLTVAPDTSERGLSMAARPKVLIIIALDAMSGPGKGLFQFLNHARRDAFDYVLCNFSLKGKPFQHFPQTLSGDRHKVVLLNQRATLDPRLILQARRIVTDHGIDVIQTHGHKPNVLGFFLRFLCRKPWIGFAHGYIQGGWKIRVYSGLDRRVLRYADRVVAVSSATSNLLQHAGVEADRIRVIHNAIEEGGARPMSDAVAVRQRHGLAAADKLVGVIGRLDREKAQIVFLQAFERVVRSYPDVKALLIGDGQDRPMLEEYCRQKRLTDHVIFTGHRENIADYYQILDLLVLPSFTEGLPNVLLEAMSFAIPVLATRVGGVPEVIDADNGVLVAPGDSEALADKMETLLRNQSLRTRIGSNGRASLYPRFDPAHRALKITHLYGELLTTANSGLARPR